MSMFNVSLYYTISMSNVSTMSQAADPCRLASSLNCQYRERFSHHQVLYYPPTSLIKSSLIYTWLNIITGFLPNHPLSHSQQEVGTQWNLFTAIWVGLWLYIIILWKYYCVLTYLQGNLVHLPLSFNYCMYIYTQIVPVNMMRQFHKAWTN